MNPLDRFIAQTNGPLTVARVCRGCGHCDYMPVGRGFGRGYGFRAGNQARGRMVQHVKQCPKVAALIGVTP